MVIFLLSNVDTFSRSIPIPLRVISFHHTNFIIISSFNCEYLYMVVVGTSYIYPIAGNIGRILNMAAGPKIVIAKNIGGFKW